MKIVTLLPSATEIVCALGLRESLVAVSHECDYPDGVAALPAITSSILPHDLTPLQIDEAVVTAVYEGQVLYQVDGDLLAQIKPDLIITQGVCDVCAVNQGTVAQTMQFLPDVIAEGVQILSLMGDNFAGILRDIWLVAAAVGGEERAAQLCDGLKARWQRLQNEASSPKPKVVMLEWPEPFFFGGHWVPEMVEAAGGIDLFGKVGIESGRCTAEEIIERDPDVIVLMACGYGLEKNIAFARTFKETPAFQQLRAVQSNNIWAMDANSYCSRLAPRVVDGAEKLQAVFMGKAEEVSGVRRVV